MLYSMFGDWSFLIMLGIGIAIGVILYVLPIRSRMGLYVAGIICAAVWLGIVVFFMVDHANDPRYIAEQAQMGQAIIKFYANGTGLLNNGTLVNLKGVFGCG